MLLPLLQALRAEADGRALLLLDELGTGTDPVRVCGPAPRST